MNRTALDKALEDAFHEGQVSGLKCAVYSIDDLVDAFDHELTDSDRRMAQIIVRGIELAIEMMTRRAHDADGS